MWPTLFSLGPVTLATANVFGLLSFLTTAFVFWRKTREEHYEQEQAFDAFLLSSIFGLVVGRLGHVLFNFGEFGFDVFKWLDVVSHPGNTIFVGLFGATLFLYRYAGRHKWDQFEILDFWMLAVSAGMILRQLGNFFAGVGFGYETNLPWGMVFPTVFTKHHPTQLYLAIFFLILYLYLSWAEYHYRTFAWYRSSKKMAETGFLTVMFMIWTGLILALMTFVRPAQLVVAGISLDLIFYLGLAVFGFIMLWLKSGKSFSRN